MKIHIVQKGDTLWKLAEKYGVDFETLKKANAHLADPDMLKPGMKIKIPSNAVPAKKEGKKLDIPKEVKAEEVNPLKELINKEIPKAELKDLPKKEMPKEMQKAELPKKEMPKKETPKKELPNKVDQLMQEVKGVGSELKELIKNTAPDVLKKIIEEVKPGLLEKWSLEIEMVKNKTYIDYTEKFPVKEMKPMTPPPTPKVSMTPYKPIEKPAQKVMNTPHLMPKMDHQPCPPYPPSHGAYQWPAGMNSQHPIVGHQPTLGAYGTPNYSPTPNYGANPHAGLNPHHGANTNYGMNPYGINPHHGMNLYGINPHHGVNPHYHGINPHHASAGGCCSPAPLNVPVRGEN